MKESNPVISIIMGIYNCAETLKEAVSCIINQSFTDWELIMCDDGSTDQTYRVALEIKNNHPERKIIVLQNDKNRGLNYTLNKCLKQAKGDYIARMDGDDLCSPERFEEELKVFDSEPNISIVSTDMEFFDESGVWGRCCQLEYPQKEDFLHVNPFCHAPCMVKREAYLAVGGYPEDKRLLRVEDFHLWVKMYAAGYRGKNINKPLYQMRDDQNAYKRRKFKYRLNAAYANSVMIKEFDFPFWMNYLAVIPIVKGLVPKPVYSFFHKRRLSAK